MNGIDIILIIIIALAAAFALRKVFRDRKSGKCCSNGCGQCSGCEEKLKQ